MSTPRLTLPCAGAIKVGLETAMLTGEGVGTAGICKGMYTDARSESAMGIGVTGTGVIVTVVVADLRFASTVTVMTKAMMMTRTMPPPIHRVAGMECI